MVLLAGVAAAVIASPVLAPNDPSTRFPDRLYAPPTRVHFLRSAAGVSGAHFLDLTLEDRLRRRYAVDPARPVALRWFAEGRLLTSGAGQPPLLVLGADPLGRDVFARLLHGAWRSLGVALLGAMGAVLIGAVVGAVAGTMGGPAETGAMAVADLLLVLPAAYFVLVLRGVLPDALPPREIFLLMALFFAIAAWPPAARGVRAIVAGERLKDYAEAARAAGAGPIRLARHLLPASRGFLATQFLLLVPALLVAEVTVSFVGLGFGDAAPSWGTLLQELGNVRILTEAPWMLAPAVAIFVVVLGVQLVAGAAAPANVLALSRRSAGP
jgi:peptide/nickel transport system permease protein